MDNKYTLKAGRLVWLAFLMLAGIALNLAVPQLGDKLATLLFTLI